ncbi:MAG: hypothetical protein CMJ18_21370 [Phycisphaeraceae bacterium]|nr:hypothetical protein [Phycisphaeraceae bacterium]
MAISPEQRKHAVVLAGSILAVVGLCWLMKVWFSLPVTTLTAGERGITTNLPAEQVSAAKPQFFTLADGASFDGQGKVVIGEEQIEFIRVSGEKVDDKLDVAKGQPLTKGRLVARNPNTFKVVNRGSNDTPIAAHSIGAEVTPHATLFFPENNASFGAPVDELFYLILWITGIAFILTEAFLLFCLICFWDRPGRVAFYTTGHHKFEVGATLLVVVILVMIALVQSEMWAQMKEILPQSYAGKEDFETQEKNERAVHVQVIGMRFKWYFRNPGLDGRFGTGDDITTPTLTVPVGRDILFHIRSQDVIHSLFLPNFRVKQDAVPGMAIPGWFRAMNTGNFQIMCAELCGEGHTTMGTTLYITSQDEYRAWVREKSAEWRDINLGGDPADPDYDPEDAEARVDWWSDQGKFWNWWDNNPVRVGYAEDYVK